MYVRKSWGGNLRWLSLKKRCVGSFMKKQVPFGKRRVLLEKRCVFLRKAGAPWEEMRISMKGRVLLDKSWVLLEKRCVRYSKEKASVSWEEMRTLRKRRVFLEKRCVPPKKTPG